MTDKGVMEKAATSLDPVVRHAAIRRMEIDEEIARLDSFLSYYAEVQGMPAAAARPADAPSSAKAKPDKPDKPVKTRNSKGPRVAEAACAILEQHGKPLSLEELFAVLRQYHPDICPPKVASLRPRLHEQREKLIFIKGQGYWPTGKPLPGNNEAPGEPVEPEPETE